MVEPCGARARSTGKPCTQSPVPGARRCRFHGGAAPQVKAAAERRLAEAEAVQAVATFGLPREVDPRDALLEEVYRTAGVVDWLAERVRALEPRAAVWGVVERTDDGEKQKAAPSIWYDLWSRERRHLTEVCRVALQSGVEERRVRLAEQQGALLAGVVQAILADLDLSVEQQRLVPSVVPKHLRLAA